MARIVNLAEKKPACSLKLLGNYMHQWWSTNGGGCCQEHHTKTATTTAVKN